MSYVEELNARVMLELTEILLYCHTCEFQVLELLKVANCIFDEEEFFEMVDSYTSFKSNMEILENLLSQIDSPITMLQIITLKSMMNELKANFETLIAMLEEADRRIDADEIDFDAATMLNELAFKTAFDIVDFYAFEEAVSAKYFTMCSINCEDDGYDPRYGKLNVLLTNPFKTKREAYIYALKNGISKDMVWGMYD